MAQTRYSKTFGKAIRKNGVIAREHYLTEAYLYAKKGEELPHAKLTNEDVLAIRKSVLEREKLRLHLKENLSNAALAKQFNVHIRTVEKVVQFETWAHLL